MLYSLSLISSAQSQYRGTSTLILLSIALTPNRLSAELISTLQCQITKNYKIILSAFVAHLSHSRDVLQLVFSVVFRRRVVCVMHRVLTIEHFKIFLKNYMASSFQS